MSKFASAVLELIVIAALLAANFEVYKLLVLVEKKHSENNSRTIN